MSDALPSDAPPIDADGTPAAEAVADLAAAHDRVVESEAAIDEAGESAVETAADAHRRATRLLDSYADSATGTGDFGAYLTFQNRFLALVDSLPDDVLAAEGFERASDRLDKRRLSEADFAFAREAIEPAGDAVAMLEEREDAYDAYRAARHAAKTRLADLRAEADRLREIRRLGEADLSTPLDPLREPIDAYNEAVRTAFDRYRRDRSARELFDLLAAAADRPLVDVSRPPRDLAEYIETAPAGAEPLSTLREYADYSPSKLDHYVADPGALRTHVAVHQTYLDRLGPEPFLVGWPPAEAAVLRRRLGELAPLTRRLDSVFGESDAHADDPFPDADPDLDPDVLEVTPRGDETAGDREAVAANPIEVARRTLARLTRTDEYERLRAVAVADAELDDETFERLAGGEIAADLADVEAGIDALEAALEAYAVDGD